jgi:hypothetical protein
MQRTKPPFRADHDGSLLRKQTRAEGAGGRQARLRGPPDARAFRARTSRMSKMTIPAPAPSALCGRSNRLPISTTAYPQRSPAISAPPIAMQLYAHLRTKRLTGQSRCGAADQRFRSI